MHRGYPADIGLSRLKPSLTDAVTSADRTDHISLRRLRLPRLMLFRRVRFTNPFTYGAKSLRRQASLGWLIIGQAWG
jgi:hypothetical protein